MTDQTIYITQADAEKIRALLWEAGASDYRGSPYLKQLRQELDRAVIVEPENIPPDVITMNSTAVLADAETGEEMVYTLVFPDQADLAEGKISILAPIGTGMLGYRVGSSFVWDTPGGPRTLRVSKVTFQPEASGNYQ